MIGPAVLTVLGLGVIAEVVTLLLTAAGVF